MATAAIWPALDYSRVPYTLYHDPELYQQEQDRIFRGKTWSFLALDVEIPRPGDFRATYLGETPVVIKTAREVPAAAPVSPAPASAAPPSPKAASPSPAGSPKP